MSEDLSIAKTEPATQEELNEWYALQEELDEKKAREMELRKKIFQTYFPKPNEGTNNFDLPESWVMKGKYVINRNLDVGQYDALRDQFRKAGIEVDGVGAIVVPKPTFVLSVYRELTKEQALLFDQCLVISDGAPGLEIVQPKRRGKKSVNS